MAIIDMSVVMVEMHNASMEATKTQVAHRKKTKRGCEDDDTGPPHGAISTQHSDKGVLELPHEKQIHDLLAWHVGLLNSKWYVHYKRIGGFYDRNLTEFC